MLKSKRGTPPHPPAMHTGRRERENKIYDVGTERERESKREGERESKREGERERERERMCA